MTTSFWDCALVLLYWLNSITMQLSPMWDALSLRVQLLLSRHGLVSLDLRRKIFAWMIHESCIALSCRLGLSSLFGMWFLSWGPVITQPMNGGIGMLGQYQWYRLACEVHKTGVPLDLWKTDVFPRDSRKIWWRMWYLRIVKKKHHLSEMRQGGTVFKYSPSFQARIWIVHTCKQNVCGK